MRYISYLVITLISLSVLTGCGVQKEYNSMEALANALVKKIDKEDEKGLLNIQIGKKEYLTTVFSNSPEAKQDGSITGDDFWRIIFSPRQRYESLNIINHFRPYNDLQVISVGKPFKSVAQNGYIIHKKVPLKIKARDKENGKYYSGQYKGILGIVLEKNHKYRLIRMVDE